MRQKSIVLGALLASVLVCSPETRSEVVSFPSNGKVLKGELYRPAGKGPFPAILYNHGSPRGMEILDAFNALGPAFAKRGWVFFGPYRRGQGRSVETGSFIGDAIDSARREGGLEKAQAVMVHLLETEQLADQLAGLQWLKVQAFVQPDRIAVGGNSFGGIEAVFGVEHGGYCAGIDSAGGAESWSVAPALRAAMMRAVRNARAPLFLFQAKNDVDLAPTRVLSKELATAKKIYISKIYPPFGKSSGDGHTFGYFGSSVWIDDALRFLDQYCR